MKFINEINFISIKELDREYRQINNKMMDIIKPLFKDNFYGSIDRNILVEKIEMISDKFTLAQVDFLVDSIIVFTVLLKIEVSISSSEIPISFLQWLANAIKSL